MADQEYTLVYKSDTSDMLGKTNVLIRALRLLDSVADRLLPKLNKLFSGAGNSAKSAAPKIQAAASSMASFQASTTTAAASVASMTTALNGVNTASRAATANTNRATTSVAGFNAQYQGLRLMREAMEGVRDAADSAREYVREAAEDVLKINHAVRELRATKGNGTTTKEASDEVIGLMTASGASQQDAVNFDTIWESTVPSARKKGNWGLNDAETKTAKTEILKWAVANGVDPKVMGEAAAAVAIAEPVKSADELMGKVGTMTQLGLEGVGNISQIMTVYKKLKGTMVRPEGGGAFRTSEELLASISTNTADTTPGATKTMADQVWRDLVFADNDTKKETFKKYGLNPGDDYQTRVEKIAPLVEGAVAQGKDPLEALKGAGFGRTGSNPKIIMAVKSRKLLAENLKIARANAGGGTMRAGNERFLAENPNLLAEAAVTAAKLGRGEDMTDLVVMRKFAEAGLDRNKEINTPWSNFEEGGADWVRHTGAIYGEVGQQGRPSHLDAEVRARLRAAVPGIGKRFPRVDEFGLGNLASGNRPQFPAFGEDLSKIIQSLTPAERQAFDAEMRNFGATGKRGTVPAQRRPAGASTFATGLIGALSATAVNTLPGGAAADPEAKRIQQQQLDELKKLNAKVGGNRPPAPPAPPLRPDVDDGGARR